VVQDHGALSMDGNGAWRDKGFVERLWYEEVYLSKRKICQNNRDHLKFSPLRPIYQ
jgi:hypothetical protein